MNPLFALFRDFSSWGLALRMCSWACAIAGSGAGLLARSPRRLVSADDCRTPLDSRLHECELPPSDLRTNTGEHLLVLLHGLRQRVQRVGSALQRRRACNAQQQCVGRILRSRRARKSDAGSELATGLTASTSDTKSQHWAPVSLAVAPHENAPNKAGAFRSRV
jgi:hypothetical protein